MNTLTDKMAHTDKLALQRRVAQLTMDYIYNIIVKTKSKKELTSASNNYTITDCSRFLKVNTLPNIHGSSG